jgi:ParD-like antitoxin of type II bacterial toxin-antitoxin system
VQHPRIRGVSWGAERGLTVAACLYTFVVTGGAQCLPRPNDDARRGQCRSGLARTNRALLKRIEAHARAEKRSLSGQIKYYAALGMNAKDNPDLPLSMIEGILEGREEFRAGLAKPYEWGVIG